MVCELITIQASDGRGLIFSCWIERRPHETTSVDAIVSTVNSRAKKLNPVGEFREV